MNLENLVKSFPKGKGTRKKHDWMLHKVYDWLDENTDHVGLFKEFELMRTNNQGEEYVAGEIDILAIYENKIEIFSIKSGGFHYENILYQFKKEAGYVLTEMAGTNMRYFVIHPGKLRQITGDVKVW